MNDSHFIHIKYQHVGRSYRLAEEVYIFKQIQQGMIDQIQIYSQFRFIGSSPDTFTIPLLNYDKLFHHYYKPLRIMPTQKTHLVHRIYLEPRVHHIHIQGSYHFA